jgi:hypothetical protein
VSLPDKVNLVSMVKTGSSYCSQSEMPLTFGLGKVDKALSVEVVWPKGTKQTLTDVGVNQEIIIEEGKGITSANPIVFARP